MGVVKKVLMGLGGLFVLIMLIGSCMGGSDSSKSSSGTTVAKQEQKQEKVYAEANIDVLLSEAKSNAAAAKRNYNKKDVKIVGGHIFNIDSDLSYLTLEGSDKWAMMHIRCDIRNNEKLKDAVVKLQKGQRVNVYGTIKDVGDIMGYYVDMEKIEPAQ